MLTSDARTESELEVLSHLPTRLDRTDIDSQDYGHVYEPRCLVAMPDFEAYRARRGTDHQRPRPRYPSQCPYQQSSGDSLWVQKRASRQTSAKLSGTRGPFYGLIVRTILMYKESATCIVLSAHIISCLNGSRGKGVLTDQIVGENVRI